MITLRNVTVTVDGLMLKAMVTKADDEQVRVLKMRLDGRIYAIAVSAKDEASHTQPPGEWEAPDFGELAEVFFLLGRAVERRPR